MYGLGNGPVVSAVVEGLRFRLGSQIPTAIRNRNDWQIQHASSAEPTGFNLWFAYNHDQPGNDVGGAPTPTTVTLDWKGSHVESGETFNQQAQYTGITTNPWQAGTIVTNLSPGNWNISVFVNGRDWVCPTAINLPEVSLIKVTVLVDEGGNFAGCESD